jgi:hypothetical protein
VNYQDNVISFCSRAGMALPSFLLLSDKGNSCQTGDLSELWAAALPLVERACSAARFTVSDAWEFVQQGQIVPLGLLNDAGDFTIIVLAYQMELPEGGPVLAGVVAPDGPWDFRFQRVIEAMFDMASTMQVEGLALISPDLVPVRWEQYEYSGGECVLYRFDDPPRQETVQDVLTTLWAG